MARILIITHPNDAFLARPYLLSNLAATWQEHGHRVIVAVGSHGLPEADVAILHVDLSVIPDEYRVELARYPVVVNGAALDIRKRVVSRNLVERGDGWTGAVVVKADLNDGGLTEQQLAYSIRSAKRDLRAGEVAYVPRRADYQILPSSADVPDSIWRSSSHVVERFLPERDARGYALRVWVFFGDRERCTRWWSDRPIVKGANARDPEPISVPDELRAERERLGFDYGKFDFAIHDGQVVLFDANRTPGAPPPGIHTDASNAKLAGGIEAFLK